MHDNQDSPIATEIIALERAALDRWYSGDPSLVREILATSITYFDPWILARLDGKKALEDYMKPITGKVFADRYEMLNPKVQVHGDIAILTFNLVTYDRQDDGTEKVIGKWNATDIYCRIDGDWKTIHMHWSYTNKEYIAPSAE